MNISSVSINRPVLAIVMSLLIMIFGIIGFNYLGVREFPSIDPPIISVRTSYAGANADVIKSQITEPLEKAINGIAGIRNISSTSAQGISNITVEFNLDADLEAAANDVRDKVSQALRQLPQDIDAPPVVSKADANSDAIISLTIQSDTKNQLQVSDFAENVIAERLQTIPGVSSVQIWGQKKYAMRIWMDPARLAAFRLTPLDVLNALNNENVELPAGKLAGNKTELIVNTYGKLKDPEQFNNLVITNTGTQLVKLSDIGYAELGPENEETILKESGVPMVAVALVPQPGSNYLDIAREFYKRLDLIKRDISSDYKLNIALDNTRFVQQSVTEVKETIFIAIALVILIIYLFFRDWIIALRPLIDIPVSLIGAFFIMYLTGFSINVLTLLAIVLATGLVVDDGIVVTENIYKKVEAGMDPTKAAHEGSKEIFFAIVSTSITLAAVFLPIIFLQGFVGRLFREFGVVIAGAVIISAFVSLTLTPMLNAKMLRKGQKHSKFYLRTEPFFEWMNNSYRNLLTRFMKRRSLAFVIILLSGVLIFVVGRSLQSELAPLDDRSFLRLAITAPEGASYEYTDAYMTQLSNFISDSIPEKKVLLTVTAPSFSGSGAVNTGFARLTLKDPDQRHRSQQMIADYLSSKVRNFQQAKTFVLQQQTISAGGGGAASSFPVQFVLETQDFDKLREAVPRFMEEAQKSKVFQGVDVNLKFNKPELDVEIDREKAKSLGLSIKDIAQTMQLAFSGQRFSYFEMYGKQYQVIAQFNRENRDEPLDLKSLFVRNDKGELIQLDNVVSVVEKSSPPQLYSFNRYESATISAGLAPGKTVGDGVNEMNRIANSVLDDSFTTDLSGASRDYAESGSNILFAFGLALILIYLILAAQFESFVDPFVIMITVPLALAGAVLSLWIFGKTLNIFSEIGIIMLIGLVTKNGILIVEFANQKREQGMAMLEATIEASVSRFRPILMTSLATMLGALPIALAIGAGAKSRVSMGIVVIGGLLFSLVLTLFVIPAMYSLMSRKRKIAHD
ncbi:MAG: efflux RND transporter permease subunit [Bacteroidetes bacterium]|jgi:multidrug efflux pump|nr:efflux RND transporter permease subunit [Bacteroidota bacterium]